MLENIIEWIALCFGHFGWVWTAPMLINGFFVYRMCSAFLALSPSRFARAALYLVLSGCTAMVIWVGDNNLLFTLPVFFAAVMLCSRGNVLGRLALTSIFFCLTMSVCAMIDTYLGAVDKYLPIYYDHATRLLRPVVFGLTYLLFRRHLPEQQPRLSPRLWRLTALLAAMPLCSLMSTILLTYERYDSAAVWRLTIKLGLAVLPFVFLTSLVLLASILVLSEHERLERAGRLAEQRESYYQTLRRQERQVRTLRHDMRNHVTAVLGLLERGETEKAAAYLEQISGSPALAGGARVCENETANAVLSAKREELERLGLRLDIAVSLPEPLPIADTDLCALLGNALDNAMESAARSRDKKVTLRCRVEKGLFMLRIENAADGEVKDDLSTTKSDKVEHGFGLACMREIAERCGGSLEAKAAGGRFELVACIPI